jgi:hypothetical protein
VPRSRPVSIHPPGSAWPPGGEDHLSRVSGGRFGGRSRRQAQLGDQLEAGLRKQGGQMLRLPQMGRLPDTISISCARAMSCAIPIGHWVRTR